MDPTSYDALQLQGRETVPKNLREWCSWCEICVYGYRDYSPIYPPHEQQTASLKPHPAVIS